MSSTMKILLVNPRWAGFGNRKKVKVREEEVEPLTLGIIAALSPGHDVTILDENVRGVRFGREWDLVGITATTFTAPRAYEIAERFRALRIPVVMGGVHASMMPQECLLHCDAVVRGEAEPVWQTVLQDVQDRALRPLYEGGMLTDMSQIPIPRRDLYSRSNAQAVYVQFSRGCGWTCEFCYLQYVKWEQHRMRPIEQIVDEVKDIPQPYLLIVDDNLFIDRAYALQVFEALTPLRKYWWAQAPTTIGDDDELLAAAYRSGCFALSIGFQTVNNSSLQLAQVAQNRIEYYAKLVQNLHKHKLLVDGTFIFGFDTDTPAIFKDTVDSIRALQLDAHTFYMVTPYPETPFYRRLEADGRIVDKNWAHYDWDHAVIEPKGMSAQQLTDGVKWAYDTMDAGQWRWVAQQLQHNAWVLRRSPKLAAFLLRQNLPQRYAVDY